MTDRARKLEAAGPGLAQASATAVAAGRRTLAAEAKALADMADRLDAGFVAMVERIAAARGRVVVTGMGKSGHIACKIAATLASTGTPALFVHPAEASHGDLGMILPDDLVLALSNSGETAELGAILAYCKRFGIGVLALTSRAESTLARAADVALVLPPFEEACPLGLAPTTSTTLMLALGDAIAVALLESRGFTPADFRALHPGGRLGRKLLRVRDLMHVGEEVPLVTGNPTMGEALLAMTAKRFGCIGVVDAERRLLGMITDGDLRRHMTPDLLQCRADTVMTARPVTTTPEAFAAEVLRQMNARQINSMFVIERDQVAGIVHVHDILRAGVA